MELLLEVKDYLVGIRTWCQWEKWWMV